MPDASHHLLQVLRKNRAIYQATLVSINKKQAVIEIGKSQHPAVESALKIHVGQAISRGDRMDYAIQKAVELGVTEITPLLTEFSQVKLVKERLAKKIAHRQSIAVSSAEQSGWSKVPTIHAPVSFCDWAQNTSDELKFICCPR